jgi:hypothetical protein
MIRTRATFSLVIDGPDGQATLAAAHRAIDLGYDIEWMLDGDQLTGFIARPPLAGHPMFWTEVEDHVAKIRGDASG